MNKKIKIVGHGLTGCVLALSLFRRNVPFHIIGSTQPGEASMASSGLINPITGRRYVKAWMIDDLIEKALDFYRWTEQLLGSSYFFPVDIIRFLPNKESIEAWEKRLQDPEYVAYISNKRFDELDSLQNPYGILTGGYQLHTPEWLSRVRSFLTGHGLLTTGFEPVEDDFVENELIIYATGAVGKLFSSGIIPNKGEVLIVKLPGWKWPGIIKEALYFIPLKEEHMFWVGSHYERWPENSLPTKEGKELILNAISEFYNGEIEVMDHLAGNRPTVDDRRPLIGAYPGHPGKYIFNGMGTKGTSLAPYWADQLIAHLLDDKELPSLVSPSRYSKAFG